MEKVPLTVGEDLILKLGMLLVENGIESDKAGSIARFLLGDMELTIDRLEWVGGAIYDFADKILAEDADTDPGDSEGNENDEGPFPTGEIYNAQGLSTVDHMRYQNPYDIDDRLAD